MIFPRRGSILVLTIWVMLALTTFAVGMFYTVNQRLLITSREQENEDLHFIAEAGIKKAYFELRSEGSPAEFVSLPASCINNPGKFNDIPLGRGTFTLAYNFKDRFSGQEETRYGIMDEQSKININRAPDSVLFQLLRTIAKLDDTSALFLADAIVDYRSEASVNMNNQAKKIDYSAYSNHFLKHSDFESLEEITLVPGMTKEIARKISSYITVYGSGQVNINTASAEILKILGLPDKIVDKMMALRVGADRQDGTYDDNLVSNIDNYSSELSSAVAMSTEEQIALAQFCSSGIVGSKSTRMRVKSIARLKNKRKSLEIDCVCSTLGKVDYWRETIRTE